MGMIAEKKEKMANGIFKRGSIYYISFYYTDQTGVKRRFKQAVGSNKKEAEIYLGKKRAEAREAKLFGIRKNDEKITFEEFSKEYLDKHSKIYNKSFATDEQRLKAFNKIFGHKFLYEITTRDIENYKIERLKQGIKAATINRDIALIRSMFNRAREWDKLARPNPCSNMRKLRENNERLRFLSKEEIERLYHECRGELSAFVMFALNTGCRRGEILALGWKDVDIDRRQIFIRDSKSGRGRVIPMNDTVQELLLTLKKKRPNLPNIFDSYHREGFEGAMKRAKIEDATFHTIRHTFASHLVMEGVDIVTVSKLLGHSSIQMTIRYSHLSPEHNAKAVRVLDSILGPKGPKIVPNQSQKQFHSNIKTPLDSVTNLKPAG